MAATSRRDSWLQEPGQPGPGGRAAASALEELRVQRPREPAAARPGAEHGWRRGFEKIRMNMHTRCIFRGAAVAGDTLAGLGAHDVEIKPGYVARFPYTRGAVAPAVEGVDGKELSEEDILGRLALHINHYPVRWREWFMAVRATRGIADRDDPPYNEDYFKAFDRNNVLDDELSRISESAGRDQTLAFVPRVVAAQS